MSSSEPTRPILGKGLSHDTRSAREELEGQRKVKAVEKVGEISDEQKARQKFRQFMGDVEEAAESTAPSPFEAIFREKAPVEATQPSNLPISETAAPPPTPNLGDVEDAIVASPSYVQSSDLTMMQPQPMEDEEEEDAETALPQSDDFWENSDMPPDQPLPPQQMVQQPQRQPVYGEERSSREPQQMRKPGERRDEKQGDKRSGNKPEKEELSLFGPPGKPVAPGKPAGPQKKEAAAKKPAEKTAPLPSPFDEVAKIAPKGKEPIKKNAVEQGEAVAATGPGPLGRFMTPDEEKANIRSGPSKEKQKAEEEAKLGKAIEAAPLRDKEKDGEKEGRKGRDQKGTEIVSPSLPLLPGAIEPFAVAATTAASPYLSPSTISLFFQMVGTMYVMATPPGISRTEIVLNNPAFSNSKFYGATITIEKYATAPDSFNIRLSGNNDAVTAFRDNIPSLLAAFQNSNLPFRIGRIAAEYRDDKPVYQRKERGGEKGDAGGEDLGQSRGGKR